MIRYSVFTLTHFLGSRSNPFTLSVSFISFSFLPFLVVTLKWGINIEEGKEHFPPGDCGEKRVQILTASESERHKTRRAMKRPFKNKAGFGIPE